MGTTSPGSKASGQEEVRHVPPNTAAGAVIPLQKYLEKYVASFATTLVPPSGTTLPPNVRSTHVAFSLMPLTNSGLNNYYGGIFDDEMHFSASTVKVAALFAAGQLHAEASIFVQSGFANANAFFTAFNAALKAEIQATADSRILTAGVGLVPQTSAILKVTGLGGGSPTVDFTDAFHASLSAMIVASSDSDAAICILALGYGYINTALKKEGFFDSSTSTGIWLAGTYEGGTYVRIPCVNDHDDAQVITTHQMCRLMAMIRLKQLPAADPVANATMQSFLDEPKSGPDATDPWLDASRLSSAVTLLFSVLQDKIGFAGLGSSNTPNVYSEALIIQWTKTSQVDAFNKTIDPTNANPGSQLSGEIAVCWQNLLWSLVPTHFDAIANVINNSLSDFFDQKAL